MRKIFTGIGSREAPEIVLAQCRKISQFLAELGWTLRSGGADGCDTAFEQPYIEMPDNYKEIYLPWKGFNKNDSFYYGVCKKALELAERVHGSWDYCSDAAKKLHGRNCYQVLGKSLMEPSEFVVCWTENGSIKGGTATAIKLAKTWNVPVINLAKQHFICKESFLDGISRRPPSSN